jgi:prepilin-type N-terminal cleavage/methylation domain-containing protein
MLKALKSNRGGFTLVEIMIVVAIIALLATIAVPSFLRARKRSQATAILEEMRLIDGAKDQYAIETRRGEGFVVTANDIARYLKVGTQLYNRAVAGGGAPTISAYLGGFPDYDINPVDTPPLIGDTLRDNFSDVIGTTTLDRTTFWGSYANPN